MLKVLAEDIDTSFLGEIPLVQSIREAGDVGRPVALQDNTPLEEAFKNVTKEMVFSIIKKKRKFTSYRSSSYYYYEWL